MVRANDAFFDACLCGSDYHSLEQRIDADRHRFKQVGQTDHATYQIWQGKAGNHTRFVNHSCKPNSQFERFVWLGKQRIVLASLGIEAGGEVTVDYGDTYWHNLDKVCRCGESSCRYMDRNRLLLPAESSVEEERSDEDDDMDEDDDDDDDD